MSNTSMQITDLLAFGVKNKASDLHLSAGLPPMIRVNGDMRRINLPEMSAEDVGNMISSIMNDLQRKNYQQNLETDFSFELPNIARFRVNAFNTNRGPAAVLRTIPSKVLTLEELKAPRIFQKISDNPRGLVLVTGPTGSGKSTTLAAMMDYLNDTKPAHILTIEDPIEFVHQSKKCLVNQRELGEDTHSFANALRSALREDPDIILVGEMRDPETIGPAHHHRRQTTRPYHRRFPRRRKRNGSLHAFRISQSRYFANPAENQRRQRPRGSARNHGIHPRHPQPYP